MQDCISTSHVTKRLGIGMRLGIRMRSILKYDGHTSEYDHTPELQIILKGERHIRTLITTIYLVLLFILYYTISSKQRSTRLINQSHGNNWQVS